MPATATASRPRRPAAMRGGRGNSARVAYDLGRRGEAAPSWVGDNDSYVDAYERGVSDRDAAEAGTTRHHDDPPDDVSTSSGDSPASDSPAAAGDASGARDGTVSDSQPPASRTRLRDALRSDASSARGWAGGHVDVDDAAGLVWGMLAYAIGVAALTDPVSPVNGVKSWFRAKFFNITGATGSKTGPAFSSSPGLAGLLAAGVDVHTPSVSLPGPAPKTIGAILGAGLPTTPAPKPPPPKGTR